VVVPPTPDGSVGRRSRTLTLLTVLSGAFALVIVVCGVLLVVDVVGGDDGAGGGGETAVDDSKSRELVLSQASQFVLRVNTYGPGDLDEQNKMPEYVGRVHEVITPKLAVSFDESVTLAEQTVSGAGYARSAELSATGLESLADGRASVLVAGFFTGSYPDPAEEGRVEVEPRPFRTRIALVQVDGEWLVDDQTVLTGDATDPGAPPSTPPTTAPSEGSGQ
jgi:hypothetical protein